MSWPTRGRTHLRAARARRVPRRGLAWTLTRQAIGQQAGSVSCLHPAPRPRGSVTPLWLRRRRGLGPQAPLQVGLHVAALAADVVLEHAAHGAEGLVDGEVGVLVFLRLLGVPADHQAPARHRQLDADAEVRALAVAVVPAWPLDGDVAADDARVEALQPSDLLVDQRLD